MPRPRLPPEEFGCILPITTDRREKRREESPGPRFGRCTQVGIENESANGRGNRSGVRESEWESCPEEGEEVPGKMKNRRRRENEKTTKANQVSKAIQGKPSWNGQAFGRWAKHPEVWPHWIDLSGTGSFDGPSTGGQSSGETIPLEASRKGVDAGIPRHPRYREALGSPNGEREGIGGLLGLQGSTGNGEI
jgi:hypothetical protein